MSDDLRYPVGKFQWPPVVTAEDRARYIKEIEQTPARLSDAVAGLTDEQLATPYRPGGWTVAQVVHHVPDSHMNSYIRFRLALTETNPVIKPYDEAAWAELGDKTGPINTSLCLLDCLHKRWVLMLRAMTEEDWKRSFVHPEMGPVPLENNLALYAWHGAHHVGHIEALRRREGW